MAIAVVERFKYEPMYGLTAGPLVEFGAVVCTKVVNNSGHDILGYFYLAKQGCIQDLKKRVSLFKRQK